MSSADEFLFMESVDPSETKSVATEKRMYQIYDQNGGSYNGQIQFDTSSLSNSGQWLAYSEAYIQIPYVVSMQSRQVAGGAVAPVDISATYTAFSLGLKSGYYNIIDSISVELNNSNVVQKQDFLNFYVNYKCLTSFSNDDLFKWGPTIGFWPDTSGAAAYSGAASGSGDGYSNVEDLRTVATFTKPSNFNEGFLTRRAKTTAFNGYGGLPTMSAATAQTYGKNTITTNGAGAAQVISWVVLATIRLKDLTDFFDKYPLTRGSFFRINVNYNACFSNIVAAAANTRTFGSHIVESGNTNPMLVPSATANNSGAAVNAAIFAGANAADRQYNIACGVGSNRLLRLAGVTPALPINQCRLYVPAYTLNPTVEKNLITVNPIRQVKYLDVYTYPITGVANNTQISRILSNGVVNPKYLIVLPYADGTFAGTFAAVTVPVWQSPFDTAPATSTPLARINNFQVQVAGQNMWQAPIQYDFSHFNDEVSAVNAINGGLSTGMNCGLIGLHEWSNDYTMYVCDISRRVPSEDNVQKSIYIQGTNNSGVQMSYMCIVLFERSIKVDMRTGLLVA